MAYSIDLRKRVVEAIESGMTYSRVVEQFHVSRSAVLEWVQRYRQTGDLQPHAPPGRPRIVDDATSADLLAQLKAAPDATLQEHVAMWRNTHPAQTLSRSAMWDQIERMGWTRKKDVARPRTERRTTSSLSRSNRRTVRRRLRGGG